MLLILCVHVYMCFNRNIHFTPFSSNPNEEKDDWSLVPFVKQTLPDKNVYLLFSSVSTILHKKCIHVYFDFHETCFFFIPLNVITFFTKIKLYILNNVKLFIILKIDVILNDYTNQNASPSVTSFMISFSPQLWVRSFCIFYN